MELNTVRYVMLNLDYFTAFLLFLILLSCVMEKNKTPLLKTYMGMTTACVISLFIEAVSLTLSVMNIPRSGVLITILSDTAILGGYGLSFFYVCYVVNLIGFRQIVCSWILWPLRVLGIVSACFLLEGSFRSLFFSIREGVFTPELYFLFLFSFDIIACLGGIFLVILYIKKLHIKDVISLSTLPMFIFIFAAMQYSSFQMMYGLFLMVAVSLLIIYLMIQNDRSRQAIEQEKKLTDMNVAMMLSQIQPHFLYNALSSIRRMIKKDPEVAAIAVEEFAAYLRKNLESMNRVEPIPFADELRHLKEYLYLEKLRFGERLCVKYEINYSDFVLPVLSLQPVVENAVKHGILRKEEGGIVWIKTDRDGDHVVLTIIDNGVGFDSDAVRNDGKMHIGIDNVKNRIKMQCNGTVQIESKVGVGTTVTITIPL